MGVSFTKEMCKKKGLGQLYKKLKVFGGDLKKVDADVDYMVVDWLVRTGQSVQAVCDSDKWVSLNLIVIVERACSVPSQF